MGAQQGDSIFEKATKAYNEGDFSNAVALYHKILEGGEHSAALYFNMGNAYYKLNEIPESIYYFEKSLLLNPNDEEVKQNLSYAQNMTLDAIDTLPQTSLSRFYKNITNRFSFEGWAYLSILFLTLFVVLYIAFYYFEHSSRKRWAFITSLLFLILCVVSVVFAFVAQRDYNSDNPAIIFADEIQISAEPNENSQEVFILHAGTKVNVLDQLNAWYRIRLTDGKTGWIPSEALKLLKNF
ncbi:SH3 domain-containing protein [Maribacter sp. CXY002]|uniref:SH3 domain-containing protein n=1 Tax=Maribacter luteocoastalis TaxID=3407671 RepID=UPI003B684E0B